MNHNDEDSTWFLGFLNRLADAECTTEDWKKVQDTCLLNTLPHQQWQDCALDAPNVTQLFPTNQLVSNHNVHAIKSLNKPIV